MATVLLPRVALLSPTRLELVEVAPYCVAVLGMFLAVHFHRGRPFFVLLMVTLFYWSCRAYFGESITGMTSQGLFQAFAILLPLNIVAFSFLRERGILSVAGRLRLAFLVVQAALAGWLFQNRFVEIQPFVTRKLLRFAFLDSLTIPQPAIAIAFLGFILIALRAGRRQSPVESGFLGVLVAVFIICNWLPSPHVASVFSTAAALIVSLSIIQESYNMAFRDDLTSLPSRRALNESLLTLGRTYSIAMVDVDHFKKFNDTYGHDVGDQVLKMVAKKMMNIGGKGKAYRYGGEEFTVLFPRRRTAEVLSHLEQLRKDIAEYRLFIRDPSRPSERQGKARRGGGGEGTSVSVTVSIGVADSDGGQFGPTEVIKAADKALYRAKNKGRNQICR